MAIDDYSYEPKTPPDEGGQPKPRIDRTPQPAIREPDPESTEEEGSDGVPPPGVDGYEEFTREPKREMPSKPPFPDKERPFGN